jgi:hypothetical protein
VEFYGGLAQNGTAADADTPLLHGVAASFEQIDFAWLFLVAVAR